MVNRSLLYLTTQEDHVPEIYRTPCRRVKVVLECTCRKDNFNRLNVNLSQNVAKWVYNHVLSHRIIPLKLQSVQFVSNLIQLFVTWHVPVTCFLFLFIAWLHLNDFFPHPKFYIPKHTSKVKFTGCFVRDQIYSISKQDALSFSSAAAALR